MVLVKKGAMESNQGLPLIVVELVGEIALRALVVVDLDTLALDHDEAGVDTFDLGNELLLGYGPSLELLDDLGRVIFGRWGGLGPGRRWVMPTGCPPERA